jgi:hypothetical protein
LTDGDKQQILYNHLKFGGQSRDFRSKVKPYLAEASRVKPFLPEVARRFGNPRFTTGLSIDRYSVRAFFALPVDHLRDVIQMLHPDGRAALALIYMDGGRLTVPVQLTTERERTFTTLGSSLAGAVNSLADLRGSLVSFHESSEGHAGYWEFQHPTIGEAFRSIVAQDSQLFSLYLAGMSSFALLEETSCGDCGIEGALVIQEEDWPIVTRRLANFKASYERSLRDSYLAHRTECAFLGAYVSSGALDFADELLVSPRLATRLRECSLLSEERRKVICDRYSAALLRDLDSTSLERAGSQLYFPTEYETLLDRVRTELLPSFDNVISELARKYDGSAAPDDWLQEAYQTLEILRGEFSARNDDVAAELVEEAIGNLTELESDLQVDYVPEPDFDDDVDDFRDWPSVAAYDTFADVDS